MVAFVLDDVTGPSFAYVAKGVEQQATAEGRLCMVCTTHGDPSRELAVVEAMREQRADAVILVGGGSLDDSLPRAHDALRARAGQGGLSAGAVRAAVAGRRRARPPSSSTTTKGGAYAMTSHLLSQGHRRIVYLGAVSPRRYASTTKVGRDRGFTRAHEAFGVPYDPDLVVPATFDRAAGYEGTKRLLARGADFTAVFAATDMVAVGVFAALREAGLRIPDDVSVVGYDDIPFAADLAPGLTTVHIPTEELGRTAVRLALNRHEPQHVLLGTHIVVRGRPAGFRVRVLALNSGEVAHAVGAVGAVVSCRPLCFPSSRRWPGPPECRSRRCRRCSTARPDVAPATRRRVGDLLGQAGYPDVGGQRGRGGRRGRGGARNLIEVVTNWLDETPRPSCCALSALTPRARHGRRRDRRRVGGGACRSSAPGGGWRRWTRAELKRSSAFDGFLRGAAFVFRSSRGYCVHAEDGRALPSAGLRCGICSSSGIWGSRWLPTLEQGMSGWRRGRQRRFRERRWRGRRRRRGGGWKGRRLRSPHPLGLIRLRRRGCGARGVRGDLGDRVEGAPRCVGDLLRLGRGGPRLADHGCGAASGMSWHGPHWMRCRGSSGPLR